MLIILISPGIRSKSTFFFLSGKAARLLSFSVMVPQIAECFPGHYNMCLRSQCSLGEGKEMHHHNIIEQNS